MGIEDGAAIRSILGDIFPGFSISDVASPSGQRVVYFGQFSQETTVESQSGWSEWGQVVLKVSAGVSAQSVAYLQREANILQELNSDCFPSLFLQDLISENPVSEEPLDPKLFISVEEKIDAPTLSSRKEYFYNEGVIADLLLKITRAMKDLWLAKSQLVHRDLKPDNILVHEDGTVTIIDLGIVRHTGETGLTMSFMPHGPCTPTYASPEQLNNDKRNITFRSDFFSIGVIAYELATGINPFYQDGQDFYQLCDSILNYNPPPLTDHGFSLGFSELVWRLLGKEPYRRPRKVNLLEQKLEGILFQLEER